MSFFFGDGFELYAAPADAYMGGTYWDSGTGAFTLVAGRFSGSHAGRVASSGSAYLIKSSGSNDNIHHINIAILQEAAIAGTALCLVVLLQDGVTSQCTIVFRGDGAILLTSGGSAGAVLATYTGALTASNTWYGFEIEVVIHNTSGSFVVRKSGNPSNDFSASSLNTRGGTANNYANRVTLGCGASGLPAHNFDDFLWRSDTSAVPWAGELRCYTRMPVSDASVQWTPSGAVVPMTAFPGGTNTTLNLGTVGRYQPFTAQSTGTIATLSLTCATAVTANIKCSIYAGSTGAPTTVLGSANVVTNPSVGTTTFTFVSPVAVTQGVQYYAAFRQDVSSGSFSSQNLTPPGGYIPFLNGDSYASFPVTNPTTLLTGSNFGLTVNITPTVAVNAPFVADTQQDAAASYVSSSTVGQTDLYNIAPISGTPTGIIGVTTRALAQKSDAGTRNIALKLKSGATDVTGTSVPLNTTWGWVYRNDLVDPATGAAWGAVAVNNLSVGQTLAA